jgi:hypothetical protein
MIEMILFYIWQLLKIGIGAVIFLFLLTVMKELIEDLFSKKTK